MGSSGLDGGTHSLKRDTNQIPFKFRIMMNT